MLPGPLVSTIYEPPDLYQHLHTTLLGAGSTHAICSCACTSDSYQNYLQHLQTLFLPANQGSNIVFLTQCSI